MDVSYVRGRSNLIVQLFLVVPLAQLIIPLQAHRAGDENISSLIVLHSGFHIEYGLRNVSKHEPLLHMFSDVPGDVASTDMDTLIQESVIGVRAAEKSHRGSAGPPVKSREEQHRDLQLVIEELSEIDEFDHVASAASSPEERTFLCTFFLLLVEVLQVKPVAEPILQDIARRLGVEGSSRVKKEVKDFISSAKKIIQEPATTPLKEQIRPLVASLVDKIPMAPRTKTILLRVVPIFSSVAASKIAGNTLQALHALIAKWCR